MQRTKLGRIIQTLLAAATLLIIGQTTSNAADKYRTILNPYTGRFDFVNSVVSTTNTFTATQIFDIIQFSTTSGKSSDVVGSLYWNTTDRTLNITLVDGTVLQVGQELLAPVVNKTTSTLENGKVVYITGSQGQRPTVDYALGSSTSAVDAIGIVTSQNGIAVNQEGFVTVHGYVRGIDTSDFTEGDIVWTSTTTPGGLQNYRPNAPHHSDRIGVVTNVNQNQGSIFVNINRHLDLVNLSDVNGTPLDTTGQVLSWNNENGYFDFNKDVTIIATSTYSQNSDKLDGLHSSSFGILNATNTWTGENTFTDVYMNNLDVSSVTYTPNLRVITSANFPNYTNAPLMVSANSAGFAMSVLSGITDYRWDTYYRRKAVWTGDATMDLNDDCEIRLGTGLDYILQHTINGTGDSYTGAQYNFAGSADNTTLFFRSKNYRPYNMTMHDNYTQPTDVWANNQGSDTADYGGILMGFKDSGNVTSRYYFYNWAHTGNMDGSTNPATTEIAPTFLFGASSTTTPVSTLDNGGTVFTSNVQFDKEIYVDTVTLKSTNRDCMYISTCIKVNGYVRPENVWHIVGGTQNANVTVPINVANTWYRVTNAAQNLWSYAQENDGFSMTLDTMTIVHKGDYTGHISLSFSGTNSQEYAFRIYNLTQAKSTEFPISVSGFGATNNVLYSRPIYIEANAGDRFILQVRNETGTGDIVIHDAIFQIMYFHE